MPKLVLIRHGESIWNVEPKRFAGRANIPLTDLGREQATQAGKQIAEIDFEIAYTSTLIRAQETLLIVNSNLQKPKMPIFYHHPTHYIYDPEKEIPVFITPDLDEINCGRHEGVQIEKIFPHSLNKEGKTWYKDYHLQMPDGESFLQVLERVKQAFENLVLTEANLSKNILVVDHGLALTAAAMFLENLKPENLENISFPNAVPRIYDIQKSGSVSLVKE